jgi:hypothetical protein
MREFDGNLLIGGMTLKHLHGELQEEARAQGSRDWLLTGRLSITPHERPLLELHRTYRLELEDGRAGQVILSRIEPVDAEHLLVEFAANRPVRSCSA